MQSESGVTETETRWIGATRAGTSRVEETGRVVAFTVVRYQDLETT